MTDLTPFITIVAAVACHNPECLHIETSEELREDLPAYSRLLNEDEWKAIDGMLYCPGCARARLRNKRK